MAEKYNIMVVDDEKTVRESIALQIPWNEYGIEAFAAANALEALELLKDHKVELMLVDIRMPVMSGLELLKRVKEMKCGTEVLILSGYADFSYAQEAIRYGAREYLLKPLEQEALVRSVLKYRDEWEGESFWKDIREQLNIQSERKNVSAGHCSHTVQKVLQIVQEELKNEELSLKWISAQRLFLNENYLSRLFQKEVGIKFSAYLLEQRMITAMRQLAGEEEVLIAEVAKNTGFGDNAQYFSSTFKKYTGYTPSEYRKKVREELR